MNGAFTKLWEWDLHPLPDDLTPPADGALRVRVHHLMYGLEALPLAITDHTGGDVATVTYGAPIALDLPIASFDADGDSTPDSHMWWFELTAAGSTNIPVIWSADLDRDEALDDGSILDIFVLPAPDVLPPVPVLLIHSESTQQPGQFTPPAG